MSVFAPTREVMEDLMERVEAILQEEEETEVSIECPTVSLAALSSTVVRLDSELCCILLFTYCYLQEHNQ